MPLALADLVFYALIFFTIALAFTTRKITAAILGPLITFVNHLPWIGSAIAGLLTRAEQAVAHACGTIEDGCDSLIGSSWHVLSRQMDRLWHVIVGTPTALLQLARIVGGHVYSVSGLRALVHFLTRLEHTTAARIRPLVRRLDHLLHRVKALEHDISKGIGEDVLPRIRSLDRELHKLRTGVIPRVEAEAAAAERDVTALGEYVRAHYLANTQDEIAAAVAVGLAALGLGGLRCNSNPFKDNPNACGLWGDLSALLGLAALTLGALNLEQLVGMMQGVTEETVGLVESTFGVG